jgi:hypothetical protein
MSAEPAPRSEAAASVTAQTPQPEAGMERRPSSRYPDFFVVGHHKSGTSALYEMLRRHPQIFMPDLKEPRFLASDMRSRFRYEREQPHPQSEDEYLELFTPARAGQLTGEASATYLWSQTAARRIAEVSPRARIIAILREPASFLRSLHTTFVRGHVEFETDLRRALALEDERRRGRQIPKRSHLPQLLLYSEHVRYAEQLGRYLALFPEDQVLILIYDDFRDDNAGTLRNVFSFLGLDADADVERQDVNVTSRTVRSHRLHDLVDAVALGKGRAGSAARTLVKSVAPRRLRRGAFTATRRHLVTAEAPAEDPELMLEIRRRFKPEVLAAGELLGRDLVGLWGYDELD